MGIMQKTWQKAEAAALKVADTHGCNTAVQVSSSEVEPTAGNVTSVNISDDYKPMSNGGDVSAALAAADRGGSPSNGTANAKETAQSRATDSRR